MSDFDESGEFRGNLDIQRIIYEQIMACNRARATGDRQLYEENVMQLQLLLPWQKQLEIEDESEDYVEEIREWRSVTIEGDKYSDDPRHPTTINALDGIRYNPKLNARWYEVEFKEDETVKVKETFKVGGEHWISPEWCVEKRLTPDLLFKKIMQKLQSIGYTHKQDEQQVDWGDIPKDEVPPPTPTFELETAPEDADDEG